MKIAFVRMRSAEEIDAIKLYCKFSAKFTLSVRSTYCAWLNKKLFVMSGQA